MIINKYLLLLLISTISFAQVDIHTTIDRDTLLIGEPLSLDISIKYPKGYVLDIPGAEDTFAPFEILKKSQKLEQTGDEQTKRLDYQIAIYDTGRFTIPPAMIIANTYKKEQSIADTLFSSVFTVYCQMSKPDTMQTIHPPDQLIGSDFFLYLLIGVLLLLVLIFFLWRWYLKRKLRKMNGNTPESIVEPADVIAMRKLKQLKKSAWLKDKKYKEWYTELNLIFREYLENRYDQINALELPSSEILPIVNEIMEIDDLSKVRDFFRTSDLVKFARFEPGHISHEDYLNWVENWVLEDTRKLQNTAGEANDE